MAENARHHRTGTMQAPTGPAQAAGTRTVLDVRGRQVVVVGLGVSGLAAARWLAREGARVIVSEKRPLDALDPKTVDEMRRSGIVLETGGHREESFLRAHLIVLSPGVPHGMPVCMAAAERGIPVIGEMELAARILRTPIVAVTGTNGKSTVTECVGALLGKAGCKTFVGGNLGTPLMVYASGDQDCDYAVVEVSSFQLDTTVTFRPRVAVILNITPDHLDRYPDFDGYVQSKHLIARNQGPQDHLVLNDDDPHLARFEPAGGPIVLRYGFHETPRRNAFLEGGTVRTRMPDGRRTSFSLTAFSLPGRHNLENLMSIVLVGLALEIPHTVIQTALESFQPLPNRLEKICEIRGVSFYNDSKATNVDAAVRAIESLPAPIILIAGGRHKGADYKALVKAGETRIKHAVFIGEAGDLLAADFEDRIPCSRAASMEEAVSRAYAHSAPGDVVLLAPACSSFDMFSDYAHRGRVFRSAVEALGLDR